MSTPKFPPTPTAFSRLFASAFVALLTLSACGGGGGGSSGTSTPVANNPTPAPVPDPGPTPEEELFRKADVDRVRAAIEAIPEPFRETVVLRDLEDLSYAEIAEVTGVPIGTVMSRLSRARNMLATELLPARKEDGEQSRSVK